MPIRFGIKTPCLSFGRKGGGEGGGGTRKIRDDCRNIVETLTSLAKE